MRRLPPLWEKVDRRVSGETVEGCGGVGAKLEHPSSDFAFGSATALASHGSRPPFGPHKRRRERLHPLRFVILGLDPRIHAATGRAKHHG